MHDNPKKESFPKYLDEQNIQYLYDAAQIELQIDDNRVLAQKDQGHLNTHDQLHAINKQQNQMNQIKEQVKQLMRKNKLMVKKPVFVQGIDPLNPTKMTHVIKWENFEIEQNQQQEMSFKISRFVTDSTNAGIKDINQKIVQLQQQLEQLQIKESDRIFRAFINKKHLSDLQVKIDFYFNFLKELKMIYYALFGMSVAEVHFTKFIEHWTEQKQINPQIIINGLKNQLSQPILKGLKTYCIFQTNKDENHRDENEKKKSFSRSTLPQIPNEIKQKFNQIERNLTKVSSIDYKFDMLSSSKNTLN